MCLRKGIVFIICLVMLLCLCSCKGKGTANESSQSGAENANGINTTVLSDDDTIDPENFENQNGIGTQINADQLTDKKGKSNGIDVSKWQGEIDWKKVKASGIDFAIIRIGYRAENGKIYKDEYADYNIQQADKAGLLVGVYFFSTAKNREEALSEAEWTVEAVKYYSISYPIVYDCEGFLKPESRMYGISAQERTDNALAFLNYIKQNGYDSMLYAAKNEIEYSAYWQTERIEKEHKIWIAYYPEISYPQIESPKYEGRLDMWQYTNMGKVDGVNGNADMAVSYFAPKKAEPQSSQKPPAAALPEPKDGVYTDVNEQVTAKEVVNLRSGATTKSDIVGSLKNGETLTRTAIGNNGWSKLNVSGKTVYAISSYLTTDLSYKPQSSGQVAADDGFSEVNEKVTAKEVVNLRSAPGTSSQIEASLKNGEIAVRTGINNATGWSRISYNGKILYAVSSYLTTDLNYKPEVSQLETDDGFTPVSEKVTAKSETNLRSVPSSKDDNTIVYTLKNGEYVTRIGINNATGWSKLDFGGQTVYAISSYLTQ